ncbi:MAG: helix-turn-helix domain-containing protein [Oscillospiraceae bacterium]|nr:helix-turn-helix domain-containing protein [Oscillospiraceae bacterium]
MKVKQQKYLPGNTRERLQDLMKQRRLTQAELATHIGIAESTISRFISGKTDKLSDANIKKIANEFDVSTDFMLGIVNEPNRKNYDISELGLSAAAAKNLYTGKVNAEVVNRLLTNPHFAEATYLISRYLNEDVAKGFAAQNQIYDSVAALISGNRQAVHDVKSLKTPIYQADMSAIQRQFTTAVKEIKEDVSKESENTKRLTKEICDKMISEIAKGSDIPNRKITAEDMAEVIAQSVSGLDGVSDEQQEQIKQMFLLMVGGANE